jgi:hypothetical protein
MNAAGNLKRPVRVEDLSGFWVDGEVLSKNEYHEFQKRRIQARKERRNG